MFTPTHHNDTLCIHCLSCYIIPAISHTPVLYYSRYHRIWGSTKITYIFVLHVKIFLLYLSFHASQVYNI